MKLVVIALNADSLSQTVQDILQAGPTLLRLRKHSFSGS